MYNTHTYIHTYIHVHTYIHTDTCTYIHTDTCTHTYIHTYMYINTYWYMYTYICTHIYHTDTSELTVTPWLFLAQSTSAPLHDFSRFQAFHSVRAILIERNRNITIVGGVGVEGMCTCQISAVICRYGCQILWGLRFEGWTGLQGLLFCFVPFSFQRPCSFWWWDPSSQEREQSLFSRQGNSTYHGNSWTEFSRFRKRFRRMRFGALEGVWNLISASLISHFPISNSLPVRTGRRDLWPRSFWVLKYSEGTPKCQEIVRRTSERING